jgi:hypothetical protein
MRSIEHRRSSNSIQSNAHSLGIGATRIFLAEPLEPRRLLSVTVSTPGAHPLDATDLDGSYSVTESWSVTVTDPYNDGNPDPVFTRTGTETGTIQVTTGTGPFDTPTFNLINTTGSDIGSPGGGIQNAGSQYSVNSEPVLYAFTSVGSGFYVIAEFSFFAVLVPLPSNFGFSLFQRDDRYSATGSSLSDLQGSATAVDGNGETYNASSTSTLAGMNTVGPAAQVVCTAEPVTAFAGVAISPPITVAVLDSNDNVVTSDSSTITLNVIKGPAGVTLGPLASAIAVNGVATFSNLVLTIPGSYTLLPTDGSLTSIVSNPFTVVAGSVDTANMNEITGWAYDPSDPTESINVEVVISGGPTQTFEADQTRSDLQSVLGSTNHGFTYATPVLSVGSHTAQIWAVEANGSGVLIGTETLTSQNSLFDEHYYLATNADVSAAVAAGTIATGYDHYLQYGQYEGRSPSPYWDEAWYLQENPDVAAAVTAGKVSSGFMQYYLYGQYEKRPGLLYFNTSYYLAQYANVAAAVKSGAVSSAFEQYVLYGQYEGYSPMLYFSPAVCDADNAYISQYITGEPFTSDYEWYIEYGQYEGAVGSNYYNEVTYLSDNPDVAAAVRAGLFPDGFQHWLEYGQYEGRTAV